MRLFLIPILLLSIFFWCIFGYFIYSVPPEVNGQLVLSNAAYTIISGSLGLLFTVTLIQYFIGNFFQPKVRAVAQINPSRKLLLRSLRRSFIFSISVFVMLNTFSSVISAFSSHFVRAKPWEKPGILTSFEFF